MNADAWGPWSGTISDAERVARLRELRALAYTLFAPTHPVVALLRRAESGRLDDMAEALGAILRLPALQKRRLLASYAGLVAREKEPVA